MASGSVGLLLPSVKPIRLISGSSPFCETFFDDAKAQKSNLVGEEGNGWTIAKYLLTHEREMISAFGAAPKKSLGAHASEIFGTDDTGRLANGILRQNIAQYQLDTLAFGATMARVGDEAKAGQGLGAASSIFFCHWTVLFSLSHSAVLQLPVGTSSWSSSSCWA